MNEVKNPSHDKSLTIRQRLSDFLGKYSINLNGARPNPFPEITEVHKKEVIDFTERVCFDREEELVASVNNLNQKVEGLSKAIEKFLYDASFTPPWEEAGGKWVQIIQHLDRTHKQIMEIEEDKDDSKRRNAKAH